MSVYTRQYTAGVEWYNSPSVSSPLCAENLNVMDAGLQAVDAAVANACDILERMAKSGGMDTIKNLFFTVSCINSNMTEIGGNGNGDGEQYAT